MPPNASPATGTADVTFDTATKLLTWKVTYSGLTGPGRDRWHDLHGPAEAGKNAAVAVPIPNPASGVDGSATLNGRPGGRSARRQVLHQRPHRCEQGRRNSRPGHASRRGAKSASVTRDDTGARQCKDRTAEAVRSLFIAQRPNARTVRQAPFGRDALLSP